MGEAELVTGEVVALPEVGEVELEVGVQLGPGVIIIGGLPQVFGGAVGCMLVACTLQLPFLLSSEEPLVLFHLPRAVFPSGHLSAFCSLLFLSLVFPLLLFPIYQTFLV